MKTIHLIFAAVSALAIATPLAAQPRHDRDATHSRSWNDDRPNMANLRMQLDAGISSGTITRREASTLRTDLNALSRLERIYGRDGFSRSERNTLMRRSAGLERLIHRAERNLDRGSARAGWERGRDDGYAETIAVGVDQGHRGDRFSGDLRVGQRFSKGQVALPVQYRTRYRDSERSYYRYDANRVYEIDRSSGLILAMFDVSN